MVGARSPVEAKRAQRAAIERALRNEVAPKAGNASESKWPPPKHLCRTEAVLLLALFHELTLFDRCEDKVGNARLRELTGLSEREVAKGASLLERRGVLKRQPGHMGKDGSRVCTTYTFPWDDHAVTPDRGVSDPLTTRSETPDHPVPRPRSFRDTSEVGERDDHAVTPGWDNPAHREAIDRLKSEHPHLRKAAS